MRYALEATAAVLACLALGFTFGYHEGQKTSWVRCPSVPSAAVHTTINDNGKMICVYGEDKTVGKRALKVTL